MPHQAGDSSQFGPLDSVPIGIFILNQAFEVIFWNQCLVDWTGVSAERVLGRDLRKIHPHLDSPSFTSRLEQVFKLGAPAVFSSQLHDYLIPVEDSDGRFRLQETLATPYPVPGGKGFNALFSIQDVTELARMSQKHQRAVKDALEEVEQRKAVEAELRLSRERLHDIAMSSADWIWETDANLCYTHASGSVRDILGYAPEELMGRSAFEFMTEEEAARVARALGNALERKQAIRDMEAWNLTKSGERVCLLANAVPVLGEKGVLTGYRGVFKNITERKRAEGALRESEQRFLRLVDELGDGIMVYSLTPDNRFTYVSPGAASVLGWEPEDVIGLDWLEVVKFTPQSLPVVEKAINESNSDKHSVVFDADLYHPDGTVHTVRVNAYPVLGKDGRLLASEGFCQDITVQRRFQEALRSGEARYSLAQRAANICSWEWNILSGEWFWSDHIDSLLGFKPGAFERTYEAFMECVHPGDRDYVRRSMQKCLEGETGYNVEHRMVRPGGDVRWMAETGEVHLDAEGRPVRMYGVVRDITRRKLAMNTQKQLIEIIEASPELMGICRVEDLTLGYMNTAGKTLLGLEPEEDISGRNVQEFLPDEVRAYFRNELVPLAAKEGSWQGEVLLQRKNGERFPCWMVVITHKNQRGELDRLSAVARDISAIKNATEELRKLKRAVEQIAASIVITNLDGTIEYVNPYFYQLTGYTPEEVMGKSPSILSSGKHGREFFQELWETISSGEIWRGEICNRKKNGQLYWEDASISSLKDEKGKTTHFVAVKEDVTYQREAQARLKELVSEFESVFNTSSVGIVHLKGGRLFHRVNQRFTEIFGYSSEDLAGKGVEILHLSGEQSRSFGEMFFNPLADGGMVQTEYQFRHKDGHLVWCSLYGKAVMPPNLENGVIWVADDITHRKELDQLKADVERMMRHDLKTPLNAVINMPQLIEMEGNLTGQQLELTKSIEESGRRMLNMIDMSLAFFKMETGSYEVLPRVLNLVKVMRKVVEESRSRLSAKDLSVEIVSAGGSSEPVGAVYAMGEELLLYNALSNILVNAIEASPAGAVILIGVGEKGAGGAEGMVGIDIQNKGAVPEKIRDVFFQKYVTHGKAKGTGLGTYSAKLIVEAMSGQISMNTSESEGTTISIELPKPHEI